MVRIIHHVSNFKLIFEALLFCHRRWAEFDAAIRFFADMLLAVSVAGRSRSIEIRKAWVGMSEEIAWLIEVSVAMLRLLPGLQYARRDEVMHIAYTLNRLAAGLQAVGKQISELPPSAVLHGQDESISGPLDIPWGGMLPKSILPKILDLHDKELMADSVVQLRPLFHPRLV